MRAKPIIFAISIFNTLCFSTMAEKVRFEQLPRPVQEAIRAHAGSAQIEDIDMRVRDGVTSYEAAFKKNGEHRELLLGADGTMLNADGTPLLDSRKMTFEELPVAVQRMVRVRSGNAPIEDIDRMVKDGQVTYEVSFKKGTQQQELLLSHDGKILRDIADTGLGADGQVPVVAAASPGRAFNLQPNPVPLSAARKIELEKAPQAVRATILARSNGAPIEDLDLAIWNGQPVYQAAFKSEGRHVELQVADDGRIIHDPRLAAPRAVGAPAAGVTGKQSSKYQDVIQPVPVSAGQKIKLKEAPLRVQNALRQEIAGANIEDLEMGRWQGRTVYEAAFKWNGQHVELQLDEDGAIIFDPRALVKE